MSEIIRDYLRTENESCPICGKASLELTFRNTGNGVSFAYFKCESCGIKVGKVGDVTYMLDFELYTKSVIDWNSVAREAELDQLLVRHVMAPSLNKIPVLASVTEIHAEYSVFNDVGLASVCKFPRVKFLNLVGTSITGKGLNELRYLTDLKELHVSNTDISSVDVATLKCLMPELEIHF